MNTLRQYEIRIYGPHWGGCCAIVRGDGKTVNEALDDAAKILGSVWKPKQDGRPPELSNIIIERPNGSRFAIHPHDLERVEVPMDLEYYSARRLGKTI